MGEGLTVDEARDATFLLTAAGTWVGKSAYIAADQWQSRKVEGPLLKPYLTIELRQGDQDAPVWICLPNNPSSLIPHKVPLQRMHLGIVVPTTHHHPISPPGAKNILGIGEIKGLSHLSSLHLPQTVGWRATRVHYPWLPHCHLGLTSQTDPDIPHEVDDIERKELAWRWISPSSRMKMPKMQ